MLNAPTCIARMVNAAAIIKAVGVIAFLYAAAPLNSARAETATYLEPDLISDDDLRALSTSGDNDGFLLALGDTLGLLFDAPLNLSRGDRISVFSIPPPTGSARGQIRFGSYNSGSPVFLRSRNFWSGNTASLTVSGGLLSGCQLLGGCDYIEITTTRTRRGAAGVDIDYIVVDGQVVEVTQATPEPRTWALMIIAFFGIAMRLKALRRGRIIRRTAPTAAARA